MKIRGSYYNLWNSEHWLYLQTFLPMLLKVYSNMNGSEDQRHYFKKWIFNALVKDYKCKVFLYCQILFIEESWDSATRPHGVQFLFQNLVSWRWKERRWTLNQGKEFLHSELLYWKKVPTLNMQIHLWKKNGVLGPNPSPLNIRS